MSGRYVMPDNWLTSILKIRASPTSYGRSAVRSGFAARWCIWQNIDILRTWRLPCRVGRGEWWSSLTGGPDRNSHNMDRNSLWNSEPSPSALL